MSTPAPIDQADWGNPQAGMATYAPVLTASAIVSGGSSAIFDVSAYESVIVWSATVLLTAHDLLVMDPDGNQPLAVLTTPPDAAGNALPAHMIPVRSQRIQFTNNAASTIALNVRATSRRVDSVRSMTRGDSDTFSVALPAAAGVTNLGYLRGSGSAFLWLSLSLNTVSGWFELAQGGNTLRIAKHSELTAGPGGEMSTSKLFIVPVGAPLLMFRQASAIAATARADILYSG